ncbi:uncharacterized protein [Miscanthus floridulus]|uniref:uncharacterized protein n=1 Tax=Miscanthus floridulus TaxID=154761 RepID=UPI00345A80A8
MVAAARARARAAELVGGRWPQRRLGTTSAAETESRKDKEEEGSGAGWELSAAREYYDYRKSIYGDITHHALLVDVVPAQPTAQVYKSIGEKYGVKYSKDEILMRYRRAYEKPWGGSRLRYVDDGRPFWQHIGTSSTCCSDAQYSEDLYQYFMTEKVRLTV